MDYRKVAAACIMGILLEEEAEEEAHYQAKRARKERTVWVRPLLKEGNEFYVEILAQLQRNDPELSNSFLKMSSDDFDLLLEKIAPVIKKQNTSFRESICPGERLAITLRFLAIGDNYSSLMFLFKRSKPSICKIVSEVCAAIYTELKDEFLKMPSTHAEWKNIAREFNDRWNFPNCFGAVVGKHITIAAPPKCGNEYLNYKNQNSIVLMALVDAQFNFTFVDVGAKGREPDGGIYSRSTLQNKLELNSMNLPIYKPLPGRQIPMPYVMIADEAFPLKPYLLKPYNFRNQGTPEGIFSYRLSRARRVIENAFGIMTARFQILRRPIELGPDNAVKVVLAICTLHNFLMKRNSVYCTTTDFDQLRVDGSISEGNWRHEVGYEEILQPLQPLRSEGRGTDLAKKVRDEFKEYFIREGAVEWQSKYIYEK